MLTTDARGRIDSYAATTAERKLDIRFDPALPLTGEAPDGSSRFEIRLSGLGKIIDGTVSVRHAPGATILDWQPETPAWTRSIGFRSTLTATSDGQRIAKVQPK
ncbi:hypothetical protein [Variovorax sp. SRS16]|uniref:hypothetical protein n=1 Tax=Variovorax sp. SRS16 TaxID=282217 RepID=UPI0013A5B5F0|nr:hypothetical protein [Variovorax sp. SRS16]